MPGKKGFSNSKDVLNFAYESLERLREGESSVEQVRAEAAQLNNVSKVIHARIAYAKLAGLVIQGSNTLPDIEFE